MDSEALIAVPVTPTNHQAAQDWLHLLYDDARPEGWLSALSVNRMTAKREVIWHQVAELDRLADRLVSDSTSCDVWLGVATRKQKLGASSRGGSRDCAQLPGMWADLDIAGPNHAMDEGLPKDENEALDLLRRFPLKPTAAVRTGGGLHAWWLFEEPLDLGDAGALLERWAATWSAHARTMNLHVDNVWDAARILRVPGTLNHKSTPAQPVEVFGLAPHRRYTPDELAGYTIDPPKAKVIDLEARRRTPWTGPERPGDAFNAQHGGDQVLAASGWALVRTDQEGNSYWLHPKASSDWSAVVYADDGHTAIYSETAVRCHPSLRLRHPYDAFGLLTDLRFDGDFSKASDHLESKGYGSKAVSDFDLTDLIEAESPPTTAASVNDPWPNPEPLLPPRRPLPPWPVEVLPGWVRQHVVAVAETVQVPVDLCAQQALGAMCLLALGVDVRIDDTWTEPLCLWLATSMPSGAGKSPADKLILQAVRAIESERVAAMDLENKRNAIRRDAAKDRVMRLSKAEGREVEAFEAQMELDAIPPEVDGRLLADDATPEALAVLLGRTEERIGIVSTEAELLDMVCGLYGEKGKPANLNVYLKGWSGDDLRIDRKNGQPLHLKRPLVSVAITVQPIALAQLRGNQQAQGRGFVARFMFSAPPDMRGKRDRSGRRATPIDTVPWEAGLRRLHEAARLNPVTRFTEDSRRLFFAWLDHIEGRIDEGGDLRQLADWTSKLIGTTARLAGLIELAETGSATVDEGSMAAAIHIARYWTEHMLGITEEINVDPVTQDALVVLEALERAPQEATMRSLYKAKRHHWDASETKAMAAVKAAVELLVRHNVVRVVDRGSTGGRPASPVAVLRPDYEEHSKVLRSETSGAIGAMSLDTTFSFLLTYMSPEAPFSGSTAPKAPEVPRDESKRDEDDSGLL